MLEVNNAWLTDAIERFSLNDCPQLKSIAINEVKKRTKVMPFRFIDGSELTKAPSPLHWVIKGIFMRKSLNQVIGETGSLKSFITLWMAYCVGNGIDWNGRKVEQGVVLYIAAEGEAGLGKRLKVLEDFYGMPPRNIKFSEDRADLSDAENVERMYETAKLMEWDVKLVIFDTLHMTAGDFDENSSKDYGKVFVSLNRIKEETNAAVIVIHHVGHGDKSRGRGSSASRAAMDNEYRAERKDGIVTLTCTKAKETEPPEPMRFKYSVVDTGWFDEDGFPETSLILEDAGAFYNPKITKLTESQQHALAVLVSVIKQSGTTMPEDTVDAFLASHPDVDIPERVVPVKAWRDSCVNALVQDGRSSGTARKLFSRTRNELDENNYVEMFEDFVWINPESET